MTSTTTGIAQIEGIPGSFNCVGSFEVVPDTEKLHKIEDVMDDFADCGNLHESVTLRTKPKRRKVKLPKPLSIIPVNGESWVFVSGKRKKTRRGKWYAELEVRRYFPNPTVTDIAARIARRDVEMEPAEEATHPQ